MISDNEQPKLQVTLDIFLTSLFEKKMNNELNTGNGVYPVKPPYHATRTKDGGRAKAYRSIALLRSLARCFFDKKFIVVVSRPHLLCALLIREHAVGFFVTGVLTHVIVVRM